MNGKEKKNRENAKKRDVPSNARSTNKERKKDRNGTNGEGERTPATDIAAIISLEGTIATKAPAGLPRGIETMTGERDLVQVRPKLLRRRRHHHHHQQPLLWTIKF